MTLLAILAGAELLALVVVALAFARVVQKDRRQTARERGLLVNQILHLSGNTWEPPPSEKWEPPVEEDDPMLVYPHMLPE